MMQILKRLSPQRAMQAQYSPVGPLAVLESIHEANPGGCDYLLLLAHDVLEAPEAWQNFVAAANPDFIIMDNSLIELGYPLAAKDIMHAADIVDADILVLPDVLLDADETINLSRQAFMELRAAGNKRPVMPVVQGRTITEVMACARTLNELFRPPMLALPRVLTDYVASRTYLSKKIHHDFGKPIHLLGFSNDLCDDMRAAQHWFVTGIDSAMPIWYGLTGNVLPEEPPGILNIIDAKRPKDYFTRAAVNDLALQNMETVRSWIRMHNL
jgi:hypothetical protein